MSTNLLSYVLLACFITCQQKDKYTIWGRLVDYTYSPIVKFKLTITEKRHTDSLVLNIHDRNGEFYLKNMAPGDYLLKIEVENYTNYSIKTKVIDSNISVGEIFLQDTSD